jgi:hypothetical protein
MTEHKALGFQVKQVKTVLKTLKLIYPPCAFTENVLPFLEMNCSPSHTLDRNTVETIIGLFR